MQDNHVTIKLTDYNAMRDELTAIKNVVKLVRSYDKQEIRVELNPQIIGRLAKEKFAAGGYTLEGYELADKDSLWFNDPTLARKPQAE